MTDNSNTALWRSVEKTPIEQTKPIMGKSYQGTSPKPHYLVFRATETFGPIGIGWGFSVEERIESGALLANGAREQTHIAKVKVWFKHEGERGEVEHVGGTPFSGVRSSGKPFTDEDAPKKSVTDALIKALSMIGFAGDIFMGRYDDSKYVESLRAEDRDANPASKPAQTQSKGDSRVVYSALEVAMSAAKTVVDLDKWSNDPKTTSAFRGLPKDWQSTLEDELRQHRARLISQQQKAA